MAEEFFLVSRRQMEELRDAIEQMQRVYSALELGSGTLSLSLPTIGIGQGGTSRASKPKYKIGRGESAFSYADVAWREIGDGEFDIDEAVERIGPLIDTPSDRWRESLRRSIQNDPRFERVSDQPNVYRKVEEGSEQSGGDNTEAEEATAIAPPSERDDYTPLPFDDDFKATDYDDFEEDDGLPF